MYRTYLAPACNVPVSVIQASAELEEVVAPLRLANSLAVPPQDRKSLFVGSELQSHSFTRILNWTS